MPKTQKEEAITFNVPIEGLEVLYIEGKKLYRVTIPVRLTPQFIQDLLSKERDKVEQGGAESVIMAIKRMADNCTSSEFGTMDYDEFVEKVLRFINYTSILSQQEGKGKE